MTLRLPHVLDASVALIAEGYMSLGADWWMALEEAGKVGTRQVPETLAGGEKPAREKTEEQKVAENNAVLASLMGGLKQTSFSGAKA